MATTSRNRRDRDTLLEDLVILALFFLFVYALTYLLYNYSTFVQTVVEMFSNPIARLTLIAIALPIGIVFIAFGIRIVFSGIVGGKRIAVGFILIVVGVAMTLSAMYIVIESLWSGIETFFRRFTVWRGSP